jgi:hypothetical protein
VKKCGNSQSKAMAACLQLNAKSFRPYFRLNSVSVSKQSPKPGRIRCATTTPSKRYTITLLPGDGIGPEVISIATNVLKLAGSLEGPSVRSNVFYFLNFKKNSFGCGEKKRKENERKGNKNSGLPWICVSYIMRLNCYCRKF